MSLLTLERSSPSPHDSENEDLLSTSGSSYEGFVARDHYALCLSPRPIASLGPGRSGDQLRIFSHLKKLVKILRPDDMLRMVVELESNSLRTVTKYLVIITSNGHMGTEETIYLGTEQDGSTTRICVVGPLYGSTEIKLDGDGGFSVHTSDRQQVFKPSSVQSMWAALQMMYKAVKDAQTHNYYMGGLSHTWVSYYTRTCTADGAILNEWNLLGDIESFRPSTTPKSKAGEALERTLTNRLREVMMQADLEEVTCKMLRIQLEQEMKMDLSEYRGFLDQQMLRILGQMERPSQIFDYLYLGSEWNASNLVELKELGVKYILNISREIDNFYPEEFKYLNIRLYDLPNSELIKHWDKTYNFIKEAKSKGKKALVHCKMGISRSAATVVAYTMKEYKMSLEDALAHVKGKRRIVNPNDGFRSQLQSYEGILRARHNDRWGKQAPSRPLPLHRARSQSEPNLLDLINNSSGQIGEGEPELSFLEEHHQNEEDRERGGGGSAGDPPIFYASSSHLDRHSNPQPIHPGSGPLLSLPVNKTENIMNYLASLPNVAVEEDQGFSGDNTQCMSESGSGYSSPVSTPTDDEHIHTRYSKLAKDIRRDSKMKSEGEVTVFAQTADTSREALHEGAGAVSCEPLSSTCQISHVKTAPVPLTNMGHTEVGAGEPKGEKELASDGETAADNGDRSEKLQVFAQIPVFHQGICKPLKSTSLPREVVEHCQAAEGGTLEKKQDIEAASDLESAPSVDISSSKDSSGTIKAPQIYSVPERVKEIEEMSLQKGSFNSLTTANITPKTSPIPMETSASPLSASPVPAETKQPSLDHKQMSPLPKETKQSQSPVVESKQPESPQVEIRHPSMDSEQSPLPLEDAEQPPSLQVEIKHPSPLPMETNCSSSDPADSQMPSLVPLETEEPPSVHMETDVSPSIPKVQSEEKLPAEDLANDVLADKEDEMTQPCADVTRSSSGHSIASFASGEAGDKELQDLTAKDGPATPPSCTRHASLSPSPQLQKRPSHESHVRTVSCSGVPSVPQSSSSPQAVARSDEALPYSTNEDNEEKASLLGPGAVKARIMDIERTREHVSASDELMSRRHSPPFIPVVQLDEGPTRPLVRRHSLHKRPTSEIIQHHSPNSSVSGAAHQRRETTPPALISAWRPLVDEVPTIPVQDLKKKFEDSDSVSGASSIGSASGARIFQVEKQTTPNLRRSQSLRAVGSPDKFKNWSRRKSKKASQTISNSGQTGRPSSQN